MSFEISKVTIWSIVFSKRVASSFADEENSKIISMRKDNSSGYINNINIFNIHLFYDFLHLLKSGMSILANNFVD